MNENGSLSHASLVKKGGAKIVQGQGIIGFCQQCVRKIFRRFVPPSLIHSRHAQVAISHIIVFRDGNAVAKKRFTIPPASQLMPRADRASHQHGNRSGADGDFWQPPFLQIPGDDPDEEDEQSYRGQVGEPICHRMFPPLDDPAYRQEHPQKPEPAHKNVRLLSAPPYRRKTKARQHQPRQQHHHQRPVFHLRIWQCQVDRPERPAQITGEGYQRVFKPGGDGRSCQWCQSARCLVQHEGGHADAKTGYEKRHFLQYEPAGCQPQVIHRETSQRPAIQQQHDKRQSDQHRFAHQSQHEEEQCQPVET